MIPARFWLACPRKRDKNPTDDNVTGQIEANAVTEANAGAEYELANQQRWLWSR